MGARILVIEDNPANLELMTYLLNAFGHQAVSATDGVSGLALVRAETPDLVICDLQLPRLNGFDIAAVMKHDPKLVGIPLIAVTAFAMPGDREKTLRAGFDGYISKPIAPERFLEQIGECLASVSRRPSTAAPEFDDQLAGPSVLVIDERESARRTLRRALGALVSRLVFIDSVDDFGRDECYSEMDLILADESLAADSIARIPVEKRGSVVWYSDYDDEQLLALISSMADESRSC